MFYNYICPDIVLFWKSGCSRSNFKYFYYFSAAELNIIDIGDEAFAQEFSGKESDYRNSDDEDI